MSAFAAVLFFAACSVAHGFYTPTLVNGSAPQLIASFRQTKLYSISASGYKRDILLIDVHADTRFDAGFDYGHLLGKESLANWNALLGSMNLTKLEEDIIFHFLDYEWEGFLSKQVPKDYLDEISGLVAGAFSIGVDLNKILNRVVVFANFPGDVTSNIEWLIINQMGGNKTLQRAQEDSYPAQSIHDIAVHIADILARMRIHCSMLGAWGSRTANGRLYTMRNLDWAANTGIADNKLITVFHPKGKRAHATIGFAGLFGALAGMSEAGLTVHEAGDDSKLETFDGFPWILRLRYVMENADNIEQALALWNATNNTLGMNHGIGSASDGRFVVLETRAFYTAVFNANDPREADYVWNGTHMGAPLPDALWRTNHAYDPEMLKYATYTHPGTDTLNRYWILHDALVEYGTSGAIGDLQAVNLTSIVGDKGGSSRPSFLTCADAATGENILSVTFDPAALVVHAAFEEGRDANHVPACCNSYVRIDLSSFLKN